MTTNMLENYLTLLTIRRAARRRDAAIIGGVFVVSFMAMIALGMLDQLSGRSLYLVTALVVTFGFAYLRSWVRLQIINGSIDLIDNLQPSKHI
jgi:4-hydroxybenzoate polyprenyltransferase